jgi:tetratricopeptide (TPR) repeat protein
MGPCLQCIPAPRIAPLDGRRIARRWMAVALAAWLNGCAQPVALPAKAIALNRDAAIALSRGDLPIAEARVALALEYSGRFTEAWVNLGLIELQRGNFERARHAFLKARDLNPDLPVPHHALGLLADREGLGAEAEGHYRAALEVDPGFVPARINLARRLFDRGALEEAREHFLRLTQVAPDFAEGWAGLCESLLRLKRIEDADEVIAAAIARFGRTSRLAIVEARLLLQRDAFADAEEKLEPVTDDPNRSQAADAFAWLAVARLGEGDAPGAIDAARRALELDPHAEVAQFALRAAFRSAAGGGQKASR